MSILNAGRGHIIKLTLSTCHHQTILIQLIHKQAYTMIVMEKKSYRISFHSLIHILHNNLQISLYDANKYWKLGSWDTQSTSKVGTWRTLPTLVVRVVVEEIDSSYSWSPSFSFTLYYLFNLPIWCRGLLNFEHHRHRKYIPAGKKKVHTNYREKRNSR